MMNLPRLRRAAVIPVLALLAVLSRALSAAGVVVVPPTDLDAGSPDPSAAPSGTMMTSLRTSAFLAALPPPPPSGRPLKILVIGTGVQESIFPGTLQQNSIFGTTSLDTSDPHGFGTIATSIILQLAHAAVTSVGLLADTNWTSVGDLTKLAQALESAATNAASYDAVLLAFPPSALLDPLPYMTYSHGDRIGSGLAMLNEAILQNPAPTNPPVGGIPLDDVLRARVFAKANVKQRDAVEKFVARVRNWQRIADALSELSRLGVAVVAPAGDSVSATAGQQRPAYTQTIAGLSARSDVITVGAGLEDATTTPATPRLSPGSAIGPTLGLRPKPDFLAGTNILAYVPTNSVLGKGWKDATDPLQKLEVPTIRWVDAPGEDTTCLPKTAPLGFCALQGSSIVATALATVNIATLVATGTPNPPTARASADNEILLGLAQARASLHAKSCGTLCGTLDPERDLYPWEEGSGLFEGFGPGFVASSIPVPIGRGDLGEIDWGAGKSLTIALWGASPTSVAATLNSFLGADPRGSAAAFAYTDPGVSASRGSGTVTVTLAAGTYQGGYYAGRMTLTASSGSYSYPLSVIRDMNVTFHVDYAYTERQTAGVAANWEGERVEDVTLALLPALPAKVGLVGSAFKYLQQYGISPLDQVVRFAVTKGGKAVPLAKNAAASEYGLATIKAAPPGYWRYYVISDYSVPARQLRSVAGARVGDGLGVGIAGGGPELANVPGLTLFISSIQGCDQASSAQGPMSDPALYPGCLSQDTVANEKDPETGFCKVSVTTFSGVTFTFWLYCGHAPLAAPAAVASRSVHLIEYDQSPLKNEWQLCAVELPLDGTKVDLDAIVGRATSSTICPTGTTTTFWGFKAGAPDCLGPAEKLLYPEGHPSDVEAIYDAAANPSPSTTGGFNLPVAVLTYRFALPTPNTYTTLSLNFGYRIENAVLAVRVQAGNDAVGGGTGLVIAGDPKLSVDPVLKTWGDRDALHLEWTMISANATTGTLSFLLIPTTWAQSTAGAALGRVQLCDTAIRVKTFAKQSWGTAATELGTAYPVQKLLQADNGLPAKIVSTKSRTRARFNRAAQAFEDLGGEREDALFALHVPKDTTRNTTKPHFVRNPDPTPTTTSDLAAHLRDIRRADGTTSLTSPGQALASFGAYDPGLGAEAMKCNQADQLTGDLCNQWNANTILLEIRNRAELTDAWRNGRFFGTVPIGLAGVAAGGGGLTWVLADGDDGGAFEARWVKDAQGNYVAAFDVSDFYGDVAADGLNSVAGLPILIGWVQVTVDQQGGRTTLTLGVALPLPFGEHTVSTDLRCVTVDGTVRCT